MVYDGTAEGSYSGRPDYTLFLYVRRDQTDAPNNRSSYAWELQGRRIRNFQNTPSFSLDPKPWGVQVGGQSFGGSANLDFRGRNSFVIGTGSTGWIGHDGNGDLYLTFAAQHNAVGVFGSASISGAFLVDRIARVPSAPNNIWGASNPDQATDTTLRFRFNGVSDGGSPILEWQAQRSTTADFSANVATVGSPGTTVFTGLLPGTQYWFRARGRNAVGWGPWSTPVTGFTIQNGVGRILVNGQWVVAEGRICKTPGMWDGYIDGRISTGAGWDKFLGS